MSFKLSIIPGIILLAFISCAPKEKKASNGLVSFPAEKKLAYTTASGQDTLTVQQLLENYGRNPTSPGSFTTLKQALALSQQLNYRSGTITSLTHLGNKYMEYKHYPEARLVYRKAIALIHTSKERFQNLLPEAYSHLGNTHFYEYQYDSAAAYYYKALGILQKHQQPMPRQMARIYMNIGAVLEMADKNYERAMNHTQRALRWAERAKDSNTLVLIYDNIATLYSRMQQMDSALLYLSKARQICRQSDQTEKVQELYNSTASIWFYKKKTAQAKIYVDSAININPNNINHALLHNMACIQYYEGNFKKAIQYYKQSLSLRKGMGAQHQRLTTLAVLATIYDSIGEYRLAVRYFRAHKSLKDSILKEEKVRSVNQMEVQYRTAEKNKALIAKQLLIAKQKNNIQQLYLGLAAALLSSLILLYLLNRRKQKNAIAQLKASLAGEEKERQRMASELHDGIISKLSSIKMNFGVLGTTLSVPDRAQPEFDEVAQQLEQTIAELRSTAHNLQPSVLQNACLVAAVGMYCRKISQAAYLRIQFLHFGELPQLIPEAELNIYRIVQELLQNIVKHAAATEARVQFNVLTDALLVSIEDNGKGIPTEKWTSNDGIGLYNLRQRLKVLSGSIDITNQNGTSIYLSFDLKQLTKQQNEY